MSPERYQRWREQPMLTYPQYVARIRRRQRWLRMAGYLAGIALACIFGGCAIGVALGTLP